MSKVNNGDMPAMPQSGIEDSEGGFNDSSDWGGSGLTKREQFAAMAMQGMLASKFSGEFMTEINDESYDNPNGLTNNAIRYADALLSQLEKGNE